MKKLALIFMASAAAVFSFGVVASAQAPTYDQALGTNPPSPAAGGAYSAIYQNCQVGETVTFSQPQSTPTSVVGTCVGSAALTGSVLGLLLPQQAVSGTATGRFTAAPTAPGTYIVTATPSISPVRTSQFVIAAPTTTVPATVPASGLPATGSGGLGTTTTIAIGLLVVGLGLFVVAQVRRRQPATA